MALAYAKRRLRGKQPAPAVYVVDRPALQAIADQLAATSNAGGVTKGPNVSDSAAGPSSVSFCGSHLVRIAILGFI